MGKWHDQGRADALAGLPSDPPWQEGHRDHTAYGEGFTDGEREADRLAQLESLGIVMMDDQPPTCGECGMRVELEPDAVRSDDEGPIFRGECTGSDCGLVRLYQEEPAPEPCPVHRMPLERCQCDALGKLD